MAITPLNRQRRYLTCAETAKLVRAALKAEFPTVKFSVHSKTYSGGSSINVSWQDGPATKMVERIAKRFAGASFDGMIDLKSYHDSELNGETVHFGADYVFCNRTFSRGMLEQVIVAAKSRYGFTAHITEYGGWDVDSPDYGDRVRLNELISQAFCDPTGRVVAYVDVK